MEAHGEGQDHQVEAAGHLEVAEERSLGRVRESSHLFAVEGISLHQLLVRREKSCR